MTATVDNGPCPPGARARAGYGRWIPFWVLQASEIAVAIAFADLSIHVAHGAALIWAAAALCVMAMTADGPLGIVRIVDRALHARLVVVVAVLLAVAVWLPPVHADSEEKVVIMVTSIGLIRLATLTSITGGRRRRSGRRGEVIDATATVVTPDGQSPTPPAPDADSLARRAGRTTAAAAAVGKKAVDEHRPAVEDQVKRGIRGAGRLAGRLTAPTSTPDDPA